MEGWIIVDAGICDVVNYTYSEVVLRFRFSHFIEDTLDHRRVKLFAGQTVAATDNLNVPTGLDRGIDTIQVQWLAGAARLLGPIQGGDDFGRLGQRVDKMLDAKRAIEAYLEHTHFFAALHQVLNCLVSRLSAGSHDDDHPFRIRSADIVEQVILTADDLGELVHRLLDDARGCQIVRIHRLTGLEEHVGVLGGPTKHWLVGIQSTLPMGHNQVIIDHGPDFIGAKLFYLVEFVAGSETIEKLSEWNSSFQRGSVSDQSQVHDLLNGGTGEQGEAGGTDRHHITVIAKNGKGLAGYTSG